MQVHRREVAETIVHAGEAHLRQRRRREFTIMPGRVLRVPGQAAAVAELRGRSGEKSRCRGWGGGGDRQREKKCGGVQKALEVPSWRASRSGRARANASLAREW